MHKNDLSNRLFSFHIQNNSGEKKYMFLDSILNVCPAMTACAQNTVKAKQVDTSCCSWETEKSFPIFAGNIYCLGYRHTLSLTLQLTTNKENENPHIPFSGGVSDYAV